MWCCGVGWWLCAASQVNLACSDVLVEAMTPHVDMYTRDGSIAATVGFGDYKGGRLIVADEDGGPLTSHKPGLA